MPVYVFECPDHAKWEGLFSINDEEQEKPCPTCGKGSVKRPASFGFELRGEGWYAKRDQQIIGND